MHRRIRKTAMKMGAGDGAGRMTGSFRSPCQGSISLDSVPRVPPVGSILG